MLLVFGVASLSVAIPRSQRDGVTVSGVLIGIETHRDEKAPPAVSATMILAAVGLMIAARPCG